MRPRLRGVTKKNKILRSYCQEKVEWCQVLKNAETIP